MIHETLKDTNILNISKEKKKGLKITQNITFQSCHLPWKHKDTFQVTKSPRAKILALLFG